MLYTYQEARKRGEKINDEFIKIIEKRAAP